MSRRSLRVASINRTSRDLLVCEDSTMALTPKFCLASHFFCLFPTTVKTVTRDGKNQKSLVHQNRKARNRKTETATVQQC
ncbi:hypothetical protein L596_024897 [Steinernema carpocapsae]|uniref:Uncharacterized protein n=1 Tax=Steinernema carpocapsae TaxID=34508 RepID=A0A4U5M705_STECR|nr:hypothetical protein L596_024897 [Steinernema carpocapsae]